MTNLDRRDVHGHPQRWDTLSLPSHGLSARCPEHPLTDWNNLSDTFGQGNKSIGQNQPFFRMPPANERLRPHDLTGGELKLRLILEEELFPLESKAQGAFYRKPFDCPAIHLRREKLPLVSAVFFGAEHGSIRVLQKDFAVPAIVGEYADPNAASC